MLHVHILLAHQDLDRATELANIVPFLFQQAGKFPNALKLFIVWESCLYLLVHRYLKTYFALFVSIVQLINIQCFPG